MAPGKTAGDARPRILVADPIAQSGIDELQKVGVVEISTSSEDLASGITECDALVVRSETKVTAELLDRAVKLKVIGRAGVGVDNIDVKAATDRGILVLNSPSGNTVAAAEHAIAMLFAMVRNVPAADRSMREGLWDRKRFSGQEVRGKTLGIVGLGKIGSEVAHIASSGLGMRVLGFDPLMTAARAEQIGVEQVELDILLRKSDIVTVHVPGMRETKGMIGAKQLSRMKAGARIINVARGGIVDEEALLAAIDTGHLAGAAVDVFTEEPLPAEHPFRTRDRIVLTPHLGASTEEAQTNVAVDVARQIGQYLNGEMPPFPVNAPSIRPEDLANLAPLIQLAGRMGSFLAQIMTGPVDGIECRYADSVDRASVPYLTSEILNGFLRNFTDATINAVNATSVAKRMGISITEGMAAGTGKTAEAITITATGPDPHVIAGSPVDSLPRITRFDEFRVDVHPEGNFLVVTHDDRPGVIAGISAALAGRDINIARIDLGRDQPRGRAVLLMQVDDVISGDVLEHIRGVTGLRSLRLVQV